MVRALSGLGLGCVLLVCGPQAVLLAQDGEPEPGWTNASELSFLRSGGNAESSTLGLRNALRHVAESYEIRLDLAGLRTDATRVARMAEGTGVEDFVVRENRETERTAERYAGELQYDRTLSESFFAYASVGVKRDTFAGFRSRTVSSVGAGNQFGPGEDAWSTKIGYGATYTVQKDVTPNPTRADAFAGGRLTLDHLHQLPGGTSLEVAWVLDANAKQREDVRGDFSQSVSSALSSRISLKTTFQLLWDADPPLGKVPLFTNGEPTGQNVLVPLERFDHNVSLALVLTL